MSEHLPNCPQNKSRNRLAIFHKNGMFGMVALTILPTGQNVVGRYDHRNSPQMITHKAFETPAQAEHWFEEYCIATVTDNGWSTAYTGERNYG